MTETKMTKTMQSVLIMAMVGGSIAAAQRTAIGSVTRMPGIAMQAAGVAVTVGQVKDDLFAGTEKFAQGATNVTEINLDPTTMGMLGRSKGRDSDLASKMKFMVIHSYTYDKPGMYRMEDVEAYRKKLEGGSWVCPIHVHSNTGSTDICSRTGENETNEMVILAAEPRELTFIHMSGKMSLGELNEMSGRAAPMVLPAPPLPKVKVSPPSPPASTETAPH